jgi:hypothetical protein
MRIKFYILWYENEPVWIEGKINDIKEIIIGNGFEWVDPTVCKKDADFNNDYDKYDMILVDYRLADGEGKGKTGADIIDKIRERCYSNIIFYSQKGEDVLRKEIADRDLDGVFCSNRDDFIEKFEKVFIAYIKKIEDINNLRGLVMAETADLDQQLISIIEQYDKITCPHKKKIKNKVYQAQIENADKQKDFFTEKDETTPFEDFIEIIDFNRRSMIVNDINKREEPLSAFKYSTFLDDIIKKRNLLAHVHETIQNGEVVLKSKNNRFTFSPRAAIKIRNDILKYKTELEIIKRTLNAI